MLVLHTSRLSHVFTPPPVQVRCTNAPAAAILAPRSGDLRPSITIWADAQQEGKTLQDVALWNLAANAKTSFNEAADLPQARPHQGKKLAL